MDELEKVKGKLKVVEVNLEDAERKCFELQERLDSYRYAIDNLRDIVRKLP